jgi:hypothetical protein
MNTEDIPTDGPSDWQPMTNKHDLAVIGKLGEEVSELGAALFRCVIQGLDESEPRTHVVNRAWVENEIADVLGMVATAIIRLNLDVDAILARRDRKVAYKAPWFDALARAGQ